MADDTIRADLVVGIHFELTCDGAVMDSTSGDDPLLYLHGHGMLPQGLEEALDGCKTGDSFELDLNSDQAFGPHNPDGVLEIPRDQLPADEEIAPGVELVLEAEDGTVVPGHITAVSDSAVTVDMNHPLAGKDVHYKIQVEQIRAATAEELEHGHPHGPGGHEH